MSFNLHALYMFSTFSFMVMLVPLKSVNNALMGTAVVTVVAMLVPGSTAFVQRVETTVLGH